MVALIQTDASATYVRQCHKPAYHIGKCIY